MPLAPDRSPIRVVTNTTRTGHPRLAAREAKRLSERRPGPNARR
jgi:hypothetical protein